MGKIEIGDTVRRVSSVWNGMRVNDEDIVVGLLFTGGSLTLNLRKFGKGHAAFNLEVVKSAEPVSAPIRTVTRIEIVPGTYELPSGGMYEITEGDDGPEWVGVDGNDYDAVSCREMAAIFLQLAAALDANAKAAA